MAEENITAPSHIVVDLTDPASDGSNSLVLDVPRSQGSGPFVPGSTVFLRYYTTDKVTPTVFTTSNGEISVVNTGLEKNKSEVLTFQNEEEKSLFEIPCEGKGASEWVGNVIGEPGPIGKV